MCAKADPNELPGVTNPVVFLAGEDFGKENDAIHCVRIDQLAPGARLANMALKVWKWITELPPLPE